MLNDAPDSGWVRLFKRMRGHFLLGILVAVPFAATVLILVWVFNSIDNILQPIIRTIVGHRIPGVGFGVTLLLLYLAGLAASHVNGRRLADMAGALVGKVPMVGQLYNGIRQIMESFSKSRNTGFMKVVIIEYPRKGIKALGFVTNISTESSGKKVYNVLIPAAPNPMTGYLQIVPESEIIHTSISIDAAVRMVVSAGIMVPPPLSEETSTRPEQDQRPSSLPEASSNQGHFNSNA